MNQHPAQDPLPIERLLDWLPFDSRVATGEQELRLGGRWQDCTTHGTAASSHGLEAAPKYDPQFSGLDGRSVPCHPSPLANLPTVLECAGMRIRIHYKRGPIFRLPAQAVLLLQKKFHATRVECAYWRLPGGRYRLYWSDAGTFDLNTRAAQVHAHLADKASPVAVEEVLRGPVLSFSLLARGFEPLHASAVSLQGKCIAFAGASGAGKSSLCAYLCRKGTRFFSDDVLPLKMARNNVRASPGLRQHRLTAKSLRALGETAKRSRKGKVTITAQSAINRPLKLEGIYILERAGNQRAKTQLRRHSPSEAFTRLVSLTSNQTYSAPARMENQFRVFGWVARHVPVWTLRFPSRFSAWEEIYALLSGQHRW